MTWRDWVEAVETRFDQMKQEHGKVVVMGTSLGGTLALWLGVTRSVAAIVSMGGAVWLPSIARMTRLLSKFCPFVPKSPKGSAIFDDEARALHPCYPVTSLHAIAETYSLTKKLKPRIHEIRAPLLVMQARQDRVIQTDNASWIYQHASSQIKKLLWLENSNHIITEDVDHPIVTREAIKWVEMVERALKSNTRERT